MREYLVFHDCGKPFCREEKNGRPHFPGHAKMSAEAWRAIGGSAQACTLMYMDMDIHTLKASELEEFAQRPEWASLLIAGLCEVHANARMFGGIETSNFKAKWKQIDRRGKGILKSKERT